MDGRGVSTEEIMEIALGLAGATAVPADSAIYLPGANLRRIMLGIDVGAGELLLARQLGVDAAVAHHPAGGSAVLDFPRVLVRGAELMTEAGVPEDVARQTMQPAIARAMLRAQAANHDHAPSVARLLGLPFMNVHLPLDEYGRRVMTEAIAGHLGTLNRVPVVGDVVTALRTIPEIRDARTRVMVPVGRLDSPAGRVVVYHGAGTNGGAAVAETLFAHGVGTVVYIHLAPEEAERLRASQASAGNVVVSGHIASDLIGVNRFVLELERRGVEVVKMSGLA
jgi:hypothetical protein